VVSDFRGHQALFENFIQAVERDTTPICDGHDGRRSIALVEAIYRCCPESRRWFTGEPCLRTGLIVTKLQRNDVTLNPAGARNPATFPLPTAAVSDCVNVPAQSVCAPSNAGYRRRVFVRRHRSRKATLPRYCKASESA